MSAKTEGTPKPVLGRTSPSLRFLGYASALLVALLYLGPFVIQVVTSLKTDPEAASHPLRVMGFTPTTAAYERLFGLSGAGDGVPFLRWFSNSALIASVVTAGRVMFDAMAGYALARIQFAGRRFLFAFVVAVMAVPNVALLIPRFLVLNTFGLFDTYTGMIVPLLVDAAGIFIMKQFFESIPREIEEAARVDGAGTFRIFWSIVLPMARAALLTLTILSFQGSWNEFTHFLVATQSSEYETLTTGLARLVSGGLGGGTQYPLKLAAALLSTLPVAVLFFAFQRHFVQDVKMGAVKE
ncbi:carbohydrate ABC transporter permease [Streptomyces sp. NPDC058739]|uniref:carbohydrate ABC transporter permease n=1 Tax=Streptomyces sp. NPDC058739 TaxID=3346618 RepID=UPI00367489CB